MDDESRFDKMIQQKDYLNNLAKLTGGIAIVVFLLGLFSENYLVAILLSGVFFISAAILTAKANEYQNEADKIQERITERVKQEEHNEYIKAIGNVREIYSAICTKLQKPNEVYPIEQLLYTSMEGIVSMQNQFINEWDKMVGKRDCWVSTDETGKRTFYFMASIDSVDENVKNHTKAYNNAESIVKNLSVHKIPFDKIIGLQIVGDVTSSSMVYGGNAVYTGVQVSGIEIGKAKRDPYQVVHDVHDLRAVELIYMNKTEVCYRYFNMKSYPLLKFLLQNEKPE